MIYKLKSKSAQISKLEINVPSSKSISNRVLIINALSNSLMPINNLSDCDDSRVINSILFSNTTNFNVGHAGTAMRFLTAFLSRIVGKWTLTGSDRMLERPIGKLVDALNELGAQIKYLDKEGYPPLEITGSNLTSKVLEIDGSTSSQFISALLLIAPMIKEGLTIKLNGKIVSKPYINLTLSIMKEFGVKSLFKNNEIRIDHSQYEHISYNVESDWSAASYWYQITSLIPSFKIKLNGLRKNSFQGDSLLTEIFENLGVKTDFSKRGMIISNNNKTVKHLNINLNRTPDIAQTIAVTCVLKEIPFTLSGLETLRIKETDRINALKIELAKIGANIDDSKEGTISWDGKLGEKQENIVFDTYNDHRMAMCFAPCALKFNCGINKPEVVSKSYINYWKDLSSLIEIVEE